LQKVLGGRLLFFDSHCTYTSVEELGKLQLDNTLLQLQLHFKINALVFRYFWRFDVRTDNIIGSWKRW